jgi:hypothetical protein
VSRCPKIDGSCRALPSFALAAAHFSQEIPLFIGLGNGLKLLDFYENI